MNVWIIFLYLNLTLSYFSLKYFHFNIFHIFFFFNFIHIFKHILPSKLRAQSYIRPLSAPHNACRLHGSMYYHLPLFENLKHNVMDHIPIIIFKFTHATLLCNPILFSLFNMNLIPNFILRNISG